MKRTIYEAVAFTCIVIGFGGIAGAVEHGSRMEVSVLMLCAGAAVIYGMYKKERKEKNMENVKNEITIESLIERLKEHDIEQAKTTGNFDGSYAVLRARNEDYKYECRMEDFHFISGMIWGIKATGFITEEEMDQLINSLMRIRRRP